MNNTLKIKKLRENAVVPKYATKGAAGMDLYACIDEAVTLEPGKLLMIPTGIAIELPDSSLAEFLLFPVFHGKIISILILGEGI